MHDTLPTKNLRPARGSLALALATMIDRLSDARVRAAMAHDPAVRYRWALIARRRDAACWRLIWALEDRDGVR